MLVRVVDIPDVVSCPSNGGKKERADISEDFSMEPRFTQKCVTNDVNVHSTKEC